MRCPFIVGLCLLTTAPAFGQALPTPTFQTLSINGTLTFPNNGTQSVIFKDTLGTGVTFNTGGNNFQIKSAIAGGGSAILVTIPSQISSATAGTLTLTNTSVSGGLSYGSNLTYTSGSGLGPPGNTNVAMLWSQPNLGGALSTGAGTPYFWNPTDNIAVSGTATGIMYNFNETMGASASGNRAMLVGTFTKTTAAAITATSYGYQLVNFFFHGDKGDGGTAATPLSSFNNINPDIRCNSGDFILSCVNNEQDIRLETGTSSILKVNMDLHYGIGDAVHASGKTANPTQFTDAALVIDASPTVNNGTGKGLTMIEFGQYSQDTPWDSTASIGSTLVDVVMNNSGNLTGVGQAFIDNGWHLPVMFVRNNLIDNGNFVVKGSGDLTSGLATLAATSTGASLDVTGVVEQSATVVSGVSAGTVRVGDEIVDAVSGIWQVASLSGSNVGTVTLVRGAAVATCPTSPTNATKFGSISVITLSITCSAARNTLTLQPSGGAASFGGTVSAANFTGNGSGLTSLNVPLASSGVITASGTYTLPSGWHSLTFKAIGGGGGSGCGIVQTSGTSASGGATGGSSMRVDGEFISSVTGGTQVVITIGTGGTPCTASGTANGSTGSAATAGGSTTVAIGSFTRTAYGGGAAANGQSNANAGGGGGAGACSVGGSTTTGTAGTTGSCTANSASGGTTTAGSSSATLWGSMGGAGSPNGAAGAQGGGAAGPGPGGSGAGLAGTQVALAGGSGARAAPLNAGGNGGGGNASCTGTSQNGGNSSYTTASNWSGSDLTGGGGGGGASCIGSNGGNGGNAGGFGASGGGGGSTSQDGTHVAGSGGTSAGGAVWYVVN